MALEFFDQDSHPGQQPPHLVPLIGQKVLKAWLLPQKTTLAFLLEGNVMVMIDALETTGMTALSVEVFNPKPGADWSDIDRRCPYDPHLYDLEGRRFGGLAGDVVVFDNVGAQIRRGHEIRWVKRAS
jgi:hypothetical protein